MTAMRKLLMFLIVSALVPAANSQVLFTYGKYAVTKDEFLRAYNKNKTAAADKTMALREYLDLYIRFRLKVQAAKDMHIDTLSSLANDLKNFRAQIEESYLNDESMVNALVQEAYNRSLKDLHVAYRFFPFKDFPDSNTVEQHRSEMKWTDVGFITAFSLPYEFENVVYALQPGAESRPCRGKTGFYIFKNMEQRKAVGRIRAAQILIAIPENAKEEDRKEAKRVADSVYEALLAGADFGEAARKISNDQMSYMMGGQLPEFGVGKFDPDFENRVFSIAKDGAMLPPFQTKFGYHIVKRLAVTAIPEDSNEAFLYTVRQQVLSDNRIAVAREKFVAGILKKLNYTHNMGVKDPLLWQMTDSAIAGKKILLPGLTSLTTLFMLDGKSTKVTDWLAWVKAYKNSMPGNNESEPGLMKKFIAQTAMDLYKKKLPEINPEFRYQLQEFSDGNMLFEVMERNIWNKAAADTAGLRKYFAQNKSKYTWAESADAILYSGADAKTTQAAAALIKNGRDWRTVTDESMSKVQSDSGRYELTQIPAPPNTHFTAGLVTEPLVNDNDGTATFAQILKLYPANEPRNFEEARGLVINDYQGYLEEKWIEQLRKKYPVKVNEKVFQSMR